MDEGDIMAGYTSGGGGAHGVTMHSERGGMGTSALVVGVIGVLMSWYWPAGLVLGVLAVVFGVAGRKRVARGEAANAGAAQAGLILGAVGLVLTAVFAALIISAAM
ncbi:DUF4190 domain-containing protein [Streptomyces fuscigenes]|uniref:DUF4190 domain-containing protein n=1 Tax=Streptomyces fuscigenes TaxID=1528880 RepID=UPI001F2F2EEA|nr:DUF4190 domain-containing protein [Streptomyces fuscigenes]MCF3963682.1 DUF4190 domain-containing protein [Streptomyces fuscigenes]